MERYRSSRSTRGYGGVRHMSPPPSPPSSRRGYLMAPISTTTMTLDQRFSSLKRPRSVSPEPSSSPEEDRGIAPGSAKNRKYLADLARRTGARDAASPRNVSGAGSRAATSTASPSSSDKLERAKRIAAARAARNSISRGDVKSRLGVRQPVGRGARRGGGTGRGVGGQAGRSGGSRGGRNGARGGGQAAPSKVTVADLDSQLEEYMEGAKKKVDQDVW